MVFSHRNAWIWEVNGIVAYSFPPLLSDSLDYLSSMASWCCIEVDVHDAGSMCLRIVCAYPRTYLLAFKKEAHDSTSLLINHKVVDRLSSALIYDSGKWSFRLLGYRATRSKWKRSWGSVGFNIVSMAKNPNCSSMTEKLMKRLTIMWLKIRRGLFSLEVKGICSNRIYQSMSE